MNTYVQKEETMKNEPINHTDSISYIHKYVKHLAISNKFREQQIALTEHMNNLSKERTLYHLTLTYKSRKDQSYSEEIINCLFKTMQTRYFLPFLLNTHNIHRTSKKLIQPICLCFVDDKQHKHNSVTNQNEFQPSRLHHHVILAIHPDTQERFNALIGRDTMKQFSNMIMSSEMKPCDSGCIIYASKCIEKYPDFMSFPDKFHRVKRDKYRYLEECRKYIKRKEPHELSTANSNV
jgi:hypothetical protein